MRRILALLLSAFLLLPLTGCGGGGKKDMSFTAILPQNVSSLDPQTASGPGSAMVIGSIFEGLCRIGQDSRILPGVAERWDHNDDYTEFTFRLRKAKWSDGTPVTASDFVYGVLRALNPETKASALEDVFLVENARAFHAGEVQADAVGIWAENDRSLRIRLESPFPDFPALTAGNHYMPCSQAYFEESAGHYGLSAEYTLTNGPFTFPHIYAWNTDYNERRISLVRSETYKGEHRTVAGSLVYLIDYSETVDQDPLGALQRGDTDMLCLPRQEAMAAKEQGFPVVELDDGVTGLLLNTQADSLEYVGMRELLLRTLDRQTLLGLEGWNELSEAAGLMPGCVLWNQESYYLPGESCLLAQNDSITDSIPALLELLKASQVPSITVLCPDDSLSIDLANHFLISWNNKLGNAFNIRPMPEWEVEQQVQWGDYEGALYTLRAGGITPYNVLAAFSGDASPLLFKDPGFDNALENLDFSLGAFQALEQELRDSCVFYPLFSQKTYYVLGPTVTDVAVLPDQRVDFSRARKK